MDQIKSYLSTVIDNLQLLPSVLKKPRLVLFWMRYAKKAQRYSAIILLSLLLGVTPGLYLLTNLVYPDQEKRVLLIFVKAENRADLRDTRFNQLLMFCWSLGIINCLGVFVFYLPETINEARQRAKNLRLQANRVAASDQGVSRALQIESDALVLDNDPLWSKILLELQNSGAGIPAGGDSTLQQTRDISLDATVQAPAAGHARPRTLANERYRLERVLASGGMGVVHEAFDSVLQRPVAIKELFNNLNDSTEQVARFRQEAMALAQLTHPHIVPVYDLLEEAGEFWIVMELLEGGSLQAKLEQAKLSIEKSLDIVEKLADSLAYAQTKNITHRDIKPLNILFTKSGTPKLADFGTAKLDTSTVKTQQGLVIGSPRYMSPEQAAGNPTDWRSDMYSLGVTWFHMVTGSLPFDGDTAELMAKHITQDAPLASTINPEIPQAMDKVIQTMLAKNPLDRYATPDALLEALRSLRSV